MSYSECFEETDAPPDSWAPPVDGTRLTGGACPHKAAPGRPFYYPTATPERSASGRANDRPNAQGIDITNGLRQPGLAGE